MESVIASAQAVVFVAVAFVLLLATLLAILRIGFMRLESRLGIFRDGLPRDGRAPAWQLADTEGAVRKSPGESLQLLVFADHSLREFPALASALSAIDANREAEVLLLTKAPSDVVTAVIRALGLQFPIISVDAKVYNAYNVRVLPVVIAVERDGRVRQSGLVNSLEGVRMVLGATATESPLPAGTGVAAT